MAPAYTGPKKFHFFGQYFSCPFKAVWKNELAQIFRTNASRTNQAFDHALIGTWIRIYGQTNLRKAALKMISKLKWKKIFRKYEHAPVKFTLRMETLYGLCEKSDEDPGRTPMPTSCQRKETLVDAFPEDFRLAYDIFGGEYTGSFAEIGQIMEDHFDRDRESSSSPSASDLTEISESSNGSTKSDGSNSGRK